ncbi:ABC transporter substrate-binding protein [Actinomadura sp. DC4]|uniref:ABC transporter substrate-binding protein n=1 Tax=Actinomadura sp. DC4 TaxID=3055069 RepID=UPI0025B00683|nr:ABC transporter substrate-binding protein [Actinomadura sp. DC4]MDN3355540.1 ABC transporter substrate-binding protein [Actinomadura sp. DC4]
MHTRRPRYRRVAVSAAAVAGALALSACGAGATTAPSQNALDRIKKNGELVIATDATYAPNEFQQKGRIVGFDIDLGTEIARRLGVTVKFKNVKFDDILPALRSKTYDLGLSSITDNEQRERSLDFVTYFSAGTSLMVKAGNPEKLSPGDLSLCGKKIAVQKGTTQADELTPKSSADSGAGSRVEKCRRGGRPAPVKLPMHDQGAADLALSEGRADAVLADSPVAGYVVKQSGGKLALAGKAYDTAPYGIAVPKDEDDLLDAIQKTVKNMISDGFYKMYADIWGVADGGIIDPQVNGAG